MSVPSGHGPGSDVHQPINLTEDGSDDSMAAMDDEPLIEQVNDDAAAPMDGQACSNCARHATPADNACRAAPHGSGLMPVHVPTTEASPITELKIEPKAEPAAHVVSGAHEVRCTCGSCGTGCG